MQTAAFRPAVDGGRGVQIQLLAGAGTGHIHQPPFFLKIFGTGQRMARGEAVFHQVDKQHGVPFQPLGRMDGGKGHAPLVALFLLVLFRGFQGKVSQKEVKMAVACGHLQNFFQTLLTAGPVFGVVLLQQRAVVLQHSGEQGCRGLLPGAQSIHKAQIGQKLREARTGLGNGVCFATAGRCIELFYRLGANAAVQGCHTGKGGHIQRVQHEAGKGRHVLDMGGFGIAQAAVLTEGDTLLLQGHFQIVGVKARPEEHGNLVRQMLVQ